MARHVKKEYKVGLNREESAAAKELVRRERDLRTDNELGVGTLLREYAMPLVFARLAELREYERRGETPPEERRIGPDRRTPAAVAVSSQ